MPAEVKILIEGYISEDSEKGWTCPTITLVRDKGMNIIVDPGTVPDQDLIVESLKGEGLRIENVDTVCITHSHIDHYRNIGMFPKAKTLEYFGLWDDKGGVSDWENHFTENIEIVKTPGHNYDAITLFVKTEQGIVAICGDVFWKKDFPKNDTYASDTNKLEESRKFILQKADYVIPGHGPMYKTK